MTTINKKLFQLTLPLFALFSLTGCQEQEQTERFKLRDYAPVIEATFEPEKNNITKLVYDITLSYGQLMVTSEKEAKEVMEPINENYTKLDGVTATLTYDELDVKQLITIDPTKLNQKQLKNKEFDTSIFTELNYNNYQVFKDTLTKQGYHIEKQN